MSVQMVIELREKQSAQPIILAIESYKARLRAGIERTRRRYDNAAHRPPLPQAEHKHTSAGVEVFPALTLARVVDEILKGMHNR